MKNYILLLCAMFLLTLTHFGVTVSGQDNSQKQGFPLPASSVVLQRAGQDNRDTRTPLDQGADSCSATVIPNLPYSDSGTTAGRVNNWNSAASCAGGGGGSNAPDVIYAFTPSAAGAEVLISTCGSLFNTLLEVRAGGACPGTTQIACADAGCAGDAELRITLQTTDTYYIIVDGYGTQSGAYSLDMRFMCDVVIQAGDLIECVETVDSSHARLDCNGGPCNTVFGGSPDYTQILCGESYFAKGFTYFRNGVPYSDTDWYRFSVAETSAVVITVEAEFPALLTAGNELAACTDHSLGELGYTCTPFMLTVYDTPPGDYEFTIRPQDGAGIPEQRNYRVSLVCAATGGCRLDGVINAPGSISGNTEAAGDDCELNPSEDHSILVNVPRTGAWEFSLCDLEEYWLPQIYLTSSCCPDSGLDIIEVKSTGCGPVNSLPYIECLNLEAGTYFLTIEGHYEEFERGPYVLTVAECADCVIDDSFLAPGSVSGNTCGAGSDCPLGWVATDDHVIRVDVLQEDDWTFEVVPEGDWSPRLSLMDGCCSNIIAVSPRGVVYCEELERGTYYLKVEGISEDDCGAYALNAYTCRTRCCYGDEYLFCVDTSQTACEAMGGVCDFDRTCAEDPCLPLHLCPENSLMSQVPLATDGFLLSLRQSDLDIDRVYHENFSGITEPIAHITFWGFSRPCIENPMPFMVEFLDVSQSVVATYWDTLAGVPVESYNGEDLLEFDIVLNPPLVLDEGWVGVAGAGGDPSCLFYWMRSGIGDDRILGVWDDGAHIVESGRLAYCLGGCVAAEDVTIHYVGGTSFKIGFYAPINAEYKFWMTTLPNAEFPAGFSVASSQTYSAGYNEYTFNASSDFQKWLIVTNCE